MMKLVSLFSGSSGNAIFFSDGETRLLIDAGVSGKRIEAALKEIGEPPAGLRAILVTIPVFTGLQLLLLYFSGRIQHLTEKKPADPPADDSSP